MPIVNKQTIRYEILRLVIIGCSLLAAILPSIYQLAYGHFPEYWLKESGLYETAGAIACFMAGVLFLICFRISSSKKQYLSSSWMLLLAMVCIFIAGEEISWGQHFFDYELVDSITSTNFQKEFNLHNSMLIQSSNNKISFIFFVSLMLYLMVLPMFLVAFPTLNNFVKLMKMPTPSMLVAIVALFAKLGDILNHKIIYGSSFKVDELHLGEGVESIFELCLLILAVECFYFFKYNIPHTSKYDTG